MRADELDDLLRLLLAGRDDSAELNFTPGKPPQVEEDDALVRADVALPPLTPFMTERLALTALQGRPHLLGELLRTGSCDTVHDAKGLGRFRVHVFRRLQGYALVLRRLPPHPPALDALDLPPAYAEMARESDGLVLIAGPAGAGKTTTLAALIEEINRTRAVHVVALDSCPEFRYAHGKATINQRVLGEDFDTFGSAARAALRQGADVLVVSELAEPEAAETAVAAAESGRLVLATVEAGSVAQAAERLARLFPEEERRRFRARLAEAVRWVAVQWLLPARDRSRVVLCDVLRAGSRTKRLLRGGAGAAAALSEEGEPSADDHLLELVARGRVSGEVAESFCTDPERVARELERLERPPGGDPGGTAAQRRPAPRGERR